MRETDIGKKLRARRIGKAVSQSVPLRQSVRRVQRNKMIRARLIDRRKRRIQARVVIGEHVVDRDHLLSALDPDHARAADQRRVEGIGEIKADRRKDVSAESAVGLHGESLLDVRQERVDIDVELVFEHRGPEDKERPSAGIEAFEMAPLKIRPDERAAAAEYRLRRIVRFVLEPGLHKTEFRLEERTVVHVGRAHAHRV